MEIVYPNYKPACSFNEAVMLRGFAPTDPKVCWGVTAGPGGPRRPAAVI